MVIRNCNLNGTLRDVRIDGGKIASVSSPGMAAADTEKVYDAAGNEVIVGFADSHMHLDKCMLIERAPYLDTPAPEKGRRTREQKEKLSQEESYQNARKVILQAVRNGTIAIRTNVDVDPLFDLRGVRALLRLRDELRDLVTIQVVAFAQEGVFNYPETPDLLRQALDLGCDGVGGHTIIDKDGKGHIDSILEIAEEKGVTADFHVDESGKSEHFLLPYLAEQTVVRGLQGQVNAIHACSLAAVEDSVASDAIARSVEAGIRFIIAPTAISTRQLTRSKELLQAGLSVNVGSDNVGDFFNPLGNANVLQVAGLLTYVHRYFTEEERQSILRMICDGANGLFDRELGPEGVQEGSEADLTVLDGRTPREVLSRLSAPRLVVRKGRVVSERRDSVDFG